MRKFALGFLGLLFIPGMALSSFAADPVQTFQYWARIPATDRTCAEEAQAMGDRLVIATGVEVTDTRCQSIVDAVLGQEKVTFFTLLVTYRSQLEQVPYSAVMEPQILAPMGTQPPYATFSGCVSDIAAQSAEFRRYTGLLAVSVTCDQARSSLSGFAMKLEGFGKPLMRLHSFKLNFYGEFSREAGPQARTFIQESGANVVRDLGDTFYYYAEYSISVRTNNFGFYDSMSQCQSQLDSVREILQKGGSKRMIVRCSPHLGTGASLDALSDGTAYLSKTSIAPKYYSMDECMADRTRIAGEATRRGYLVYGTVCYPSIEAVSGRFDMDVFVR